MIRSIAFALSVGLAGCSASESEDPSLPPPPPPARPMPAPEVPPSERSWSPPELLEDAKLCYLVAVDVSARGDAVVAWDQLDGKVKTRIYDAQADRWSDSISLDHEGRSDYSAAPSLGIDDDGNVFVAWHRESAGEHLGTSIWTTHYERARDAWAEAEQLEDSAMGVAPQLAVDARGDARLVFSLLGSLSSPILTARGDAATGRWSAAETVAMPPDGSALGGASIALTSNGDAAAIWTSRRFDGVNLPSRIWAARYSASASAWGEPQPLSLEYESAQATGIAINEAGVAIAVWVQTVGEEISVWSSRSAADGGGWSDAVRIDRADGGAALLPEIALDAAGNAIAVWTADDGMRQNIWANRFAADGGWSAAAPIEDGDADATVPRIAMDRAGNALVIWTQDSARKVPWVRWFDASKQAWDPAEALEPEAGSESDSTFGRIAVAPDGRAIAVWARDPGGIFASRLR